MKFRHKSILSLKASVLIAFVAIWNAGFLYALYVADWNPDNIFKKESMTIQGLTCLFACIFSLAVAMFKPLQDFVVADSRQSNFRVLEFYFFALITAVLAISRFVVPGS